ncbi:imidazolonepropionase-like domain-containing protein [Streptomyces sp. NPDC002176]|uniref:imidazolonepropionase-like domain-containing protein n=1 Tax=Streptomyces sp. NPDC002176 TaxID=3364634 RepID=UPI00384DCAE8
MLTLHVAENSPETAVLVDGATVAAVAPYEELTATAPQARVRRWPGILLPGLLNPYAPELLEATYHPDPREADTLGTEPITGARASEIFRRDPTRLGASARRGVQRMLAHGTVAVAGELRTRTVADVVRRAGLAIGQRPPRLPGPPALSPTPLILMPPLRPGTGARFAVFDVATREELVKRGASTCVATVIEGRIVHRRR